MTQSRPAGQHTVRRHNSALVLGAIADSPGISRAGVAARTGLTKATVSSLVDRAIAADLVVDGEPARREGPGRRGTALSLSPAGPHGLGVEIGVDYIATCLVDLTGSVAAQRIRPADNRSQPANRVLAKVARAIRTALTELPTQVGGVGVAVPGLVESSTGFLRTAPNLGWRDVDVQTELRDRVDLGDTAVLVGNEANFAALGEMWGGDHGELRDFVHVSGEIGIGAGIVMDGELFEGVRGFGGEIGHLPVDSKGPQCSCGARGCLEAMAGQDTILRHAGVPDVDTLVERLRDNDRKAITATRSVARWLGTALSNVVNLLDVPTIVLGGTYARIEPWLHELLLDELNLRVVSATWSQMRILPSTLGTEAAVRGAAVSAVRAIVADPDPFITATVAV
ncbi:ROK family transcriptional regulator [Kibdelosporangium phytohabitans]|uniref:ROK family transcriptional regulator n=1 Tax=Kibdelosporangium phytohabitans TaxID=860235 RepID=A0A0N9I3K5_9PSEU|nr:ROK family transcriptional regulator [Kibdelosporangium phytohabitans]ALG09094.1 ROK family transcriptional regulator [Kibdelosporangium phytohabitans]MBE1469709.1 putative NBD/HSP70 family sugar kinase [Kibdelosporangium phytohabitans]